MGKERINVRINSKGLRDREIQYQKDSGTHRILFLGDSFTEAFQVSLESTFAKQLECKLNVERGDFEVINAGFAGVGTDWQLLFYRREGYKYDPDLVIVVFFQNDVFDNYRSKDLLESRDSASVYEGKGFMVRLKQFLATRSSAYNYIGGTLPKYAPRIAQFFMNIGLISSQPVDTDQEPEQLHWLVLSKEYPPVWMEAWEVTRLILMELKKEVEANGANLAIVSIPFKEQVYEELWNLQLALPGMKSREWDLEKPDRVLAQILKEVGIPLLCLLPEFKNVGGDTRLYLLGDGHLNAKGHSLTAELIHNWLVQENLVPMDNRKRMGQG